MLFRAFGLELKHQLFLGLKHASLRTGTMSSPNYQAFTLRLELKHWLFKVSTLPTEDLRTQPP